MIEPRMVPAWCAGQPHQVPVKPSPPDHRRVACGACGVGRGAECRDLTMPGATLWTGHATRHAAAERMFGRPPA